MLLKNNRNEKKNRFTQSSVNITSLMDVLTVLLFFLIKSFSMDPTVVKPPDNIRLPASVVKGKAKDALRISLNNKTLSVDDKVIMRPKKGIFAKELIGADGRILLPLSDVLLKEMKKKKDFYKGIGDPKKLSTKLIIQADKNIKFKTLKYVLHTAAVAGYSDYQFVVKNPDS